jgi:hypothetical protein
LAAGAENCQAVQNAVMSGQNLLASITFTGTGDYLKSNDKKKAVLRNGALLLAKTLDIYNNGGLCTP